MLVGCIKLSELDQLIRQIVREEIHLYLQQDQKIDSNLSVKDCTNNSEKRTNKEKDEIDIKSFEKKYKEALKIDDAVNEKYKAQINEYGSVITLKTASEILNFSVYAIKKLAKTDLHFPTTRGGKIGTARLMHWLDGGQAYWNIGEE